MFKNGFIYGLGQSIAALIVVVIFGRILILKDNQNVKEI